MKQRNLSPFRDIAFPVQGKDRLYSLCKTAAPHVKPAPKAVSKIFSPDFAISAFNNSSRAIPTDEADVLPYLWTVLNIRSEGRCSNRLAIASMIRILA